MRAELSSGGLVGAGDQLCLSSQQIITDWKKSLSQRSLQHYDRCEYCGLGACRAIH